MTHDQPIVRLALVDDHQVFAASVGVALGAEPDIEVVGTAHDLAGADRMLRETDPQVVLLDHRLPDGDGVTALPQLLQAAPRASFVVLTASTAEQVLVSAIENGAAGFVSKTRSLSELTSAVRAAAAGEAVISPELLARLLPRMRGDAGGPGSTRLTQREIEVLELMAQGLSNAAIAERLVVSVHTVRNHVANLSSKLDAHSKLEAVSRAMREGIIAAP
jgi:DNA-binding NarL/FixJ family response regulator